MSEDVEAVRFRIRKEVTAAFRMNALVLKRDAQEFCVKILERHDTAARKKWIERIVQSVRKQNLPNNVLTVDTLKAVVTQISTKQSDREGCVLSVHDVCKIPHYSLDPDSGKMVPARLPDPTAFHVSKASHMFRHRYQVVEQIMRRNHGFENFKPVAVESLLGRRDRVDQVVLLGMLSLQKAEELHIEDLTGSVQAEFTSETLYHQGLFPEGAIMIFEGSYYCQLFTVTGVGLVPCESAEDTRSAIGNMNLFGGEDAICYRANEKLLRMSEQYADSFLVCLSDVHLDNQLVLEGLKHVLSGYLSSPPAAFVLCGNFCSRTRQPQTTALMQEGFQKLANILEPYRKEYESTMFIFVPGPDDPSLNVLPRPPLPNIFHSAVEKVVNCEFATNPARIQIASAEVVIFRDDVVEKMCRHSVHVPKNTKIIGESAVRTMLSNAHLSPLPTYVTPVVWSHDDALSLYPLPDCLIVADKFETFTAKLSGGSTNVSNPGSFFRMPHQFMVVYPLRGESETSELGRISIDPLVN